MRNDSLERVQRAVVRCRACPELRDYCSDVATTGRRSAYAQCVYWGKPVPSFGDLRARILLVGLAPGAHGANRTGRMFTGDRSGDFLYAALHRAGLASQPTATGRDDGLALHGVYITAALHCAPPANRPRPDQLGKCRRFLVRELILLDPVVVLCLGGIAWNAALAAMHDLDRPVPRPRPRFGHAAETQVGPTRLLGSYHVSQQNTFTGRLTPAMFDAVLTRARRLADPHDRGPD